MRGGPEYIEERCNYTKTTINDEQPNQDKHRKYETIQIPNNKVIERIIINNTTGR